MKREQLSDRIGNIEDRLVEQAENVPNFGRAKRISNIRKVVLIAAVVVLMTGSFVVGAIAMNKEPDIVYEVVEEIVYVYREQEIIFIGDSGITLILPDWWKGKYEVTQGDNYMNVCHTATREQSEYGGMLFAVSFEEQIRPMNYLWPWPAFTIAITEKGTYYLGQPSDVQFDLSDPVTSAEYQALSDDIKNIQIVMSTEMLENSINMSNAIKGTVFVEYVYKDMQVADSIICDAEQSMKIIEIINRQEYSYLYNYDEQLGRYWTDLRIMYDDVEYFISLTGKTIYGTNYSARYAYLSDEDVDAIMEILSYIPSVWQPNGAIIDPPPLNNDDIESIWSRVQESLSVIISGDVNELASQISPDGEATDGYIDVAKLNIEYYSMYDLSKVELIDIVYQGLENRYAVVMSDANNEEFYLFVMYGDGVLDIFFTYSYSD